MRVGEESPARVEASLEKLSEEITENSASIHSTLLDSVHVYHPDRDLLAQIHSKTKVKGDIRIKYFS